MITRYMKNSNKNPHFDIWISYVIQLKQPNKNTSGEFLYFPPQSVSRKGERKKYKWISFSNKYGTLNSTIFAKEKIYYILCNGDFLINNWMIKNDMQIIFYFLSQPTCIKALKILKTLVIIWNDSALSSLSKDIHRFCNIGRNIFITSSMGPRSSFRLNLI